MDRCIKILQLIKHLGLMSRHCFSLYLICTSALPQKPNKRHDYILISGDSVWHKGRWFKGYCGGECQHLTHFHRFPSLISGTMMHVWSRAVTFDRAGDTANHSFHPQHAQTLKAESVMRFYKTLLTSLQTLYSVYCLHRVSYSYHIFPMDVCVWAKL